MSGKSSNIASFHRIVISIIVCFIGFGTTQILAAQESFEPYKGLIFTKSDIRKLREIVKDDQGLAKEVSNIQKIADKWVEYDIEQIKGFLPDIDAVYAYGYEGDPETGQNWERLGKGLCSLDKPGQVVSPYTGKVYGIQKLGEKYYDPGTGWVRPEDGRVFYFKGIWNSYVMSQFVGAAYPLALTYALTGEEKYAKRGLFILDAMADRIPDPDKRKGVVDWPLTPPFRSSLFCFMGNWGNTRVAILAVAFDLLAGNGRAQQKSHFRKNHTIEQLMRDRLLLVVEPGKIEQKTLQNHGLSAYGAHIAIGLLFDQPDVIREGIEATDAFLDNTVGRDGVYYETSGSYKHTGRSYGGRMITLLRNYDPKNYKNSDDFPQFTNLKERYADDPRWISVAVNSLFDLTVYGRDVPYGDAHSDTECGNGFGRSTYNSIRNYALWLYNDTANPDLKSYYGSIYNELPEWIINQPSPSLFTGGIGQWLSPEIEAQPQGILDTEQCIFKPAQRIVILRDGKAEQQNAIFFRGGANTSHANDDQMAVLLYSNGMLATSEFGYSGWGSPAHQGYGTEPAAHNMVVVDEDLPDESFLFRRDVPDADILAYLPQGRAKVVEMSNPKRFPQKDIERYQRLNSLISLDSGKFYMLDIFRVRGAETHDYFWYGPEMSKEDENIFDIEGMMPQSRDGIWSLAGLNDEYKGLSYNKPGQSWGERLFAWDGQIKDLGIKEEGDVSRRAWNPPPGNGYGFIYDVKIAKPADQWSAKWKLYDNDTYMKFTMLNASNQTPMTAKSGSLTKGLHRYGVVSRREKADSKVLDSCFVGIVQADKADEMPVANVRNLLSSDPLGSEAQVLLEVSLADGGKDYVYSSIEPEKAISVGNVRFTGRFAFARLDKYGKVTDACIYEGVEMKINDFEMKLSSNHYSGTVANVDSDIYGATLQADGSEIPVGEMLKGSMLSFKSPKDSRFSYTGNETVLIRSVQAGSKPQIVTDSLIETKLLIDKVIDKKTLQLQWPNELVGSPDTGKFNGCELVVASEPNRRTTLVKFIDMNCIEVADTSGLKAGDKLDVRAARAGDEFKIASYAVFEKISDSEYSLKSNQKVQVSTGKTD